MSLLKYIERLRRIDDLVSRKATGSATEFAARLGISRSQLLQDIKELRELGAQIDYCTIQRSYFYKDGQGLILSFTKEGSKIKGGENLLHFSKVQYHWTDRLYI